MNKKLRRIVLAMFLAVTCLFSCTFGMLAATPEVWGAISASATAAGVKITTQPKSVAVAKGKTATVKVVASGEGLTYKWYYKNLGASKYSVSSTVKGNTYSVEMNAERSGRLLYCVVTDKAGNSVKSNTVRITMSGAVTITTQPKSVAVAKGATATVKVVASGEGLTYKWYYKNLGASKYSVSSTVKGNTYSVEMNASRSGRLLYCVVTDKAGNSVKSNTVRITMSGGVTITTQPKSVAVANGKTANVKVVASGEGLTYKWYYKNLGASKYSVSSTVKGNTYSVEMNAERSGRLLYCVVTDKAGNSVKSNTVRITMSGGVAITTQPKSVAVAKGATATVKVVASGEGLTYKWYYKNAGASKFTASSTVKGATYSVEMNAERSGRQIYCVVKDKAGNSVKSNVVTLSMTGGVTITTQPKSVSVPKGQTAKVSFEAKGDGLTYKWYYKNAGSSKFTATSTFSSNYYTAEMNESRNGRQIYCVVKDKAGNSVKTNTVTLTMSATGSITITRQPVSMVTPKGQTATVSFEAKGEGLTYKWYYKNAGSSKFTATSTFSSSYYTAEMSESRNGRQIYCVVRDKYGNKVQTDTVTLHMGTPLAIYRQPWSVTVPKGGEVKITFEAEGEGLTYKWYYKNADASKFTATSSFTSSYYTTEMSASRSGRQVYCVVTDKFGNKVQTETVTMTMGTPTLITLQPASVIVAEGETAVVPVGAAGSGLTYKWYYKNPGASRFTLASGITGATYSVKMTEDVDGRQVYCVITDKNGSSVQTETATLSMKPVYEITVDLGDGNTYTVGVKKDGKYSLSKPTRTGYSFQGWQTIAGVTFASSGTVNKNTSVKAVWTVSGTKTQKDLIARAAAGAKEIVITGNITVDQPIYITHDVTIYSNGNYTIKRSPTYGGDIFVVGRDKNGVTALLHHRDAVLTLGGGTGTLTIDGNSSKVSVPVNGALIFASDSATVNMKDGARLRNNTKTENARSLNYGDIFEESTMLRVGGAAIVNFGSTVNIHGGVIENNKTKLEHTVVLDEQGVEQKKEYGGCGGAIYNDGYLNMYGGTIKGNEGLRGGAIYNDSIAYLYAGTIQDNKSYTYGGALSTSSSMMANTYLGEDKAGTDLKIIGNYSKSAGGALYSNTTAPFIIYGNTLFEGNHSDYSGGAIYTSGSLTVRNTTFRSNTSVYSAGAIFFQNSKDSTWAVREAEITACVFEENKASLGGAIVFSRSNKDDPNATGVVATITDCRFHKNEAVKNDANPGNGGAIYVTQLAKATITGCEFTENVAASSGGAVSINGQATATQTNNTYTGNSAVSGGAIYLSVDTTNTLKNLTIHNNKAVFSESGSGGNGGAIYGYSAKVTMDALDVQGNTAATNGGGIYLNSITLTLSESSKIAGNTAGDHGGAFYLTYATQADGSKIGAKLTLNKTELKGNTAKSGGAISIRTNCEATLNGAKLLNNTATAVVDDVMGGGAVYVGYGKLTLTNTTMEGNTSAYYGGAVFSRNSTVTITGGTLKNTTGATGAGLHFREGSTAIVKNLAVTENTSSGNGVLYINGGSLTMENVTATGNKASQGGVLFVSGASTQVTLTNSTWSDNSASTGGAISMTNATVTVKNTTFSGNTARLGGAIYNATGTLTTEKVAFTGNAATKTTSGSSGNGGAVSLSGGTYTASATDTFTNNTAENHGGAVYVSYATSETDQSRIGATLTATGTTFTGNTAMGGGAVSARTDCELILDGATFTGNSVTGNDGKADGYGEGGGAIYVGYGKLTLTNVTVNKNTAENYGGAVHILDSDATITGSTFAENEAATGGAVNVTGPATVAITGSSFRSNKATGNGGAIFLPEAAEAQLKELTLTDNSTDGNGGAIYIANATVTTEKLDAQGNHAGGNGGAIYLQGKEMVLTASDVFKNNSAGGHGGAFYLTYKNGENNTRTGSVLNATDTVFEGNSAMAGGAISIRSDCEANLTGVTLKANTVTGFQDDGNAETENDNNGDGEGGGAIYVGYGKLTLTNVTATGNSASDFGGVVDAVASPVTITGGVFSENTSNNGGVIHAMGGCDITVSGAEFTKNASVHENTGYDSAIGGGVFHTISGTLHITASTLDGNSSANYGGAIHSNKTAVTIDGQTKIVNNTGATGAALHMRSAKVVLENVTVENNVSKMNGVIYYAGSDLTLSMVTASGNTAVSGGVLFVNNSTVKVAGSTFSGNSAGNGGVIYSKGGSTLNLENSTMAENTATYGGAVYTVENGIVNLTGMTFRGNTATKDGGAIYDKASTVNAIDTDAAVNTFENNTAANHGGAIYVVYTTNETDQSRIPGVLNVTGGAFTGNTAMGGGAVSVRTDCEATFERTVFTENKAIADDGTVDGYGEGGGAVYVGYGKLTLKNVTATGNTAQHNGGVVHLLDTECSVEGGRFENNAAASGGAIQAVVKTTLTVTDAVFIGNASTATESDGKIGGGAINASETTLTVTGTAFLDNTSGYYGGAIHARKSTVEITGTEVKNSQGATGAALYFREGCDVDMKNVTVADNIATANGVLYINGGTLDMDNVSATGNQAGQGGVLFTSGASTQVTLKGSVWSDNSAGTGGAIYMTNATVTVTGVTFTKNTANYGGAIYNSMGTLLTQETQFTENTATLTSGGNGGNGGAIYMAGGTYTAAETDSFQNNTADGHAGAIYVAYHTEETTGNKLGGEITIPAITFSGNTAAAGGAVSIRTNGVATFTGTVFTGNTAHSADGGEGGGAVFVGYGTLTLDGVRMKENTSGFYGGAVSAIGATVEVKNNTVFEKNMASTGLAMQIREASTVTLTNVSITDNVPDKKGNGAIYVTGTANLTMENVTATGNENGNGGVIYASGTANVTISGSTFTDNSAVYNGGAIAFNSTGELSITGSTLTGNSAANGGAVYAEKENAKVTLTDCTVTDNTATGHGGAVCATNADTALVRGTMTGNTAKLGGAVYSSLGDVTLTDAVFTENTATGNGGAIVINGGSVTGVATFEDNTAAGHAGALYLTYVKGTDGAANIPSTAHLTGGAFTGNTAVGGGAVSIRTGCSGIFENVTFTANSVSGFQDDGNAETENDNDGDGEGGGAIYVGYGSVTLTNVTATGNTSVDSFGGFLDAVKATVTVTGGTYTGNSAPAGGAFYAINNSKVTITGATVSENASTFVNPDSAGEYHNNMGGGAVAITGGTLTLTEVTLDGNSSVYYGGTILINGATVNVKDSQISASSGKTGGTLYLTGSGKTTLEGTKLLNNKGAGTGTMYINSGTLELKNVTATGNQAASGAVVYASGTGTAVTVTGGTFSGNTATSGGVIFNNKGNVTVTGATFEDNTANLGGAIYSASATLTVNDSVFTENTATKDASDKNGNAGAIMVVDGTLTGSGNTFTGNTAENHGGAIYVSYVTGTDGVKNGGVVTLTGGKFENNSALCGGAISSRTAGNVTLTGTEFKGNSATKSGSGNGGGAIYTNDGTLTLSGVTFDGNTTAYYGAAVYSVGTTLTAKDNCVVKNNTGITGAAIWLNINEGQTVTITDMTLQKNTNSAGGANGTIYATGSGTLSITRLTATENVSTNGGVLYTSGGLTITIVDSILADNEALANGGAIAYRGSKTLTLTGCTVTGNKAVNGGAFEANGAGELIIEKTTVDSNTAECGGAAYATKKLTILGSILNRNTATDKGGAIFATGASATVKVRASEGYQGTIGVNTASYGGAVYMEQDAAVTIDETTLNDNIANYGGAIYVAETVAEEVTNSTLKLNRTTFMKNTATSQGGAIYAIKNMVEITSSIMEKNTAVLGGAIYSKQGLLRTTGVTFTENSAVLDGNSANGNGGAVCLVGSTYTVSDTDVFTANTAAGHAGAIYVTYASAETEGGSNIPGGLSAGAATFTKNTAMAGGALSARTDCVIELTGTKLTENSSSSDQTNAGGGAIYVGWGRITMDGVTLDGNASAYYGGAVEVQGAPAEIKNTVVKNNTGITGSALYFRDGGTVTITGTTITGNTGTAGNGTVYITGSGTLNMTDVDMSDNTNANGGILYASGSAKIYITGGEYKNNTSTGTGNADFRNSGEVVISGATFTGNTGAKGGAIYAYGASVNVTVKDNTLFKENTAKNGGAIYMDQGATVTLEGNTLDGNSSTADGGAIFVADTTKDADVATKLVMTGTVLQNNQSGARGGALSTDYGSPLLVINATNCTFQKNTSTTSGAAVCVQNTSCNSTTDPTAVTVVFKNCAFLENASTTDGGALDVRSGSCMKIDGITAEGNSAKSNGGVVYVTSNNTRLYITGEVSCKDNTAKGGNFSYLYNNSYTNPPKLYTTHSNTAEWYADVAGNRTNVVFDLAVLP